METTGGAESTTTGLGRADEVRVSDNDRTAADRLLSEHLAAGRLTSDEYAERSLQTAAVRVRSEILALFRDLPGPHPQFAESAATPAVAASPAEAHAEPSLTARASPQARHLRYAATAVIAPCAVFGAAVGLSFAVPTPSLLLLALMVITTVYGTLVLVGERRTPPGRND